MIYIKKNNEPLKFTQEKNTPDVNFDAIEKKELRNSLLIEQGYLCAYCMKRISKPEDVKIEHYRPRNPENELDYNNLLAVCKGDSNVSINSKNERRKHYTCDTCKGNAKLNIDPQNKSDMDTISYTENGLIKSKVESYQKEIDEVLNLNDDLGYLIRNRAAAIKPFKDKLHKLGRNEDAMPLLRKWEKKFSTVNESGELIEFVGIIRWYINRKIKRRN